MRNPEHWDLEADVVVAGYGYAGGVSAIAAADHGLKPLILEKMPYPGGISIMSGGGFAVALDEEKCFRYLQRTNLNTTPDPVLRAMAKGMAELPDYLKHLEKHTDERFVDNRATLDPNAEATYPFAGGEAIKSMKVARTDSHKAFPWAKGMRGGARLFKMVYDNVAARGVPVYYRTAAAELIRNPDGEITGVLAAAEAETGGKTQLRVRARRAVVLATGGFEFAEDMKVQYLWGQPVTGVVGLGNTGDGIRMAQSVGADLWHMWHFHGGYGFRIPGYPAAFRQRISGPRVPDRQMPWILLDKYGRRYMNEYPPALQDTAARDMLMYDADHTEYPRIPSALLFDEEGRKTGPLAMPMLQGDYTCEWSADNSKEIALGWIHRAGSLSELARQLQLPEANLRATVERWNQGCREGRDPDCSRPPGTMMPLENPPFYWIEAWPIVNNTQGGPVHDEHQRVLDVQGRPIPRLYATGECGSLFGHLYLEAGNAAECFVSGRNAAAHASTLPPLD